MEYILSDIIELIGGGTPKTSVPEYWNGDIPWLSVKDFSGEKRYVYETEKCITEEGLNNSSTKYLNQGDIIVSARGTVGEMAMIPFPMTFNQSCYGIRAKRKLVNPFYLYYLMKYNLGTLKSKVHGSVFDTITKDTFKQISVDLPELEVQKKVADILGNLDDKIENNEKINRNLQDQAQMIFKEWFIDNLENTSWSTGAFSDLIVSTLGGDWGKEEETGNFTEQVYCIRGADIPEVNAGNKGKMPTRYILPKNYASKQLKAGDIVVEISGGSPTQSTGRVASVSQSLLDRYDRGMVCTNFCRALKPKQGYSMFIYYYWQYLYDKGIFFLYENGTTGIKNLDINGFLENEKIVLPPLKLVDEFDDFCQAIFNQIFKNGISTEKLAETRDVLLPRLMSGELDVSEFDL